ncbi:ubiquitin carboxyl-terminal hydrolase, partial [Acinetobacter baumannii]|uniref:ubiquitin carboxyl-terminal hydrolase n=1 Tax=Acinetobacter baumannii TaxID=470 RepID=UPI0011773456
MKKAKKVRIEKNSLKQTVTLDTGKKIKHQRGFANKGNTCYVNVVLQCLSLFSTYWGDTSSVSKSGTCLISSFRKMMFSLETRSKDPIDTSLFLTSLQRVARESGKT